MKLSILRRAGFSLPEVMVAVSLAALVGYGGYSILHIGLMLFAKNSAINVAHQQARSALLRMEHDFHSSISEVQLTNSDGAPLPASTGPEAGVSFQVMKGGPFLLSGGVDKGSNVISANFGASAPAVGHRLLIPLHRVEADIIAVSGSGPVYTVTLSQNITRQIPENVKDVSGANMAAQVQCFLTERVYYTVKQGRLQRWQATRPLQRLLATGIISAAPFRISQGVNGAFDRKMVTAVDLSAADQGVSNLGFRSVNIMLNTTMPVRHRLAENL
jgi:prepilin-type N-terminal cleavage/methylation domain-containing protein